MPQDSIILNSSDPGHLKAAIGYVKSFKDRGNIRIEVTVLRNQRSLSMNAWWHGVAFPHIAAELTKLWSRLVTMEEAKALMKDRYLRREFINTATGEATGSWYTKGTHELDTEEGHAFCDQLCDFAADQLNSPIPARDEYRQESA